jgi:hypothetical protein
MSRQGDPMTHSVTIRRFGAVKVALFVALLCAPGVLAADAQEATGRTTVIRGHFSEVHYMMEGDSPAIIWDWDFTLQLSGRNAIHEEWKGHNQNSLQRSASREGALGAVEGAVSWRVLDPNRLQKTIQFRQHTQKFTIEINNKECRLNVEFRLKPGFSDMFTPRADNGEWTHFSLPKTRESSCTIS